jgi:5-methylcytosine-specific restriction endonuclease McrA
MRECANCGKTFKSTKQKITRSKSGNVFCCKECSIKFNRPRQVGESHPKWRDGEYTYRKRALEYYGCKCSICGYDIEDVLEVHHKDGNRSNNELENLDVLCPTHHKEYTVGIRKY